MTGVLAGYEDATGADVRDCRRFVGTSAVRSSRRALWRAARHAGRGRPRPVRFVRSRVRGVRRRRSRTRIGRGDRYRTSSSAPERSPPGSARRSGRWRCGRSRTGGGRSPRSGTRSTGGARRLTGACACAPSMRAMVAASCSAAGPRPRLRLGRRLRRPARSRRSSRRCASVTGCTSTVVLGRQPTPMPRPPDVAIACSCSSRPPCSSVARCARRPCLRPSRSGAVAPWWIVTPDASARPLMRRLMDPDRGGHVLAAGYQQGLALGR